MNLTYCFEVATHLGEENLNSKLFWRRMSSVSLSGSKLVTCYVCNLCGGPTTQMFQDSWCVEIMLFFFYRFLICSIPRSRDIRWFRPKSYYLPVVCIHLYFYKIECALWRSLALTVRRSLYTRSLCPSTLYNTYLYFTLYTSSSKTYIDILLFSYLTSS